MVALQSEFTPIELEREFTLQPCGERDALPKESQNIDHEPESRQFTVDEHFEERQGGGIGAAMVAVGALHEPGAGMTQRDACANQQPVLL